MERLQLGDLCQNPHWLSVSGKITLFNCKRTSATNESERSELVFRSLSFERQDNTFLKAADGAAVISGKRPSHVDIVKCKCILNVQKRAIAPFVLVSQKSERREGFQYSLFTLSSSNLLEPCIQFKLPYQIRESVSILQGPTVLWSHAGNVFYTSLQAGEVRQISIHLSHIVAGELPLLKGQIFILGLQEQCLNNLSTSQTLGYFVENGHAFDGSVILPHPYVCITRCILVLSAERVDDAGVLKSAVVAATSNQQLVYFENGAVKDVLQLPFEQPEDIQVVNTGRSGCLFAITFHQGHVCAVWKETFQVCKNGVLVSMFCMFYSYNVIFLQIASHWSDVSSVLVDDFLGCGSDQMLLVFKDHGAAGRPLERFLLTDLCGISYAVRHRFPSHMLR